MTESQRFRASLRALSKGQALDALSLANEFQASGDKADHVSAHICKGLIYEHGGEGLPADLDRAMQHYRQASLVLRDQTTFCDMARATMKKGPAYFEEGLKYLQEARSIQDGPEVDLGFAEYYKSRPEPDYPLARRYFARAARAGRFMGFFGYAEVSRRMGQNARALMVDALRLVLGPFIALLIGSKATGRF